MNNPVNVFVALDQAVDRQVVETLLTSSPSVSVGLTTATSTGRGPTTAAMSSSSPVTTTTPEVADYIAHASSLRAGRPVVLLAPVNGNGYVSDAFGHGADDVMTLPAGR